MKYIIVCILYTIVCILHTGCAINYKPETKAIIPTTERIELSGTFDNKPVTMSGKAVIKEGVLNLGTIVLKLNYRDSNGILSVLSNLWGMLQCWFWDLIIVTLLIALLTELLGNFLRPGGVKIPKMIWSVAIAVLSVIIYRVLLSSGWVYVFTLNGVCCVFANIGWHYLVNTFKVQKLGGWLKGTTTIAGM